MSFRQRLTQKKNKFLAGVGVPEACAFVPDDFQIQAIQAIEGGNDTLVVAPTGCGKTYIAIECIQKTVNKGLRAIYTAPLKALSNAKYNEFRLRFEPDFQVGLLTGDRKIEADAKIVIATTEIYRNDLYSMRGDYSLVVLDEVHYLADPQRGAVWEESIILSPRSANLLMLSASISNPEEVADWIRSVRNKEVKIIQLHGRPVELRLGFLHPEYGVVPLADDTGQIASEVKKYYSQGTEPGFRRVGRSRGRRDGDGGPAGQRSRRRRG